MNFIWIEKKNGFGAFIRAKYIICVNAAAENDTEIYVDGVAGHFRTEDDPDNIMKAMGLDIEDGE